MKKSILVLALCFVLLFAVAAVSAQEAETPAEEPEAEVVVLEEPAEDSVCDKAAENEFKVTYLENDCLAEVPVDCSAYKPGNEVTVKFDPVKYMDYKIFYGWDIDDDGIADFGYSYNKFEMPENDVELKAICVAPSWGGGTSVCRGCHLHGTYVDRGLQTFTIIPYGGVK